MNNDKGPATRAVIDYPQMMAGLRRRASSPTARQSVLGELALFLRCFGTDLGQAVALGDAAPRCRGRARSVEKAAVALAHQLEEFDEHEAGTWDCCSLFKGGVPERSMWAESQAAPGASPES